jgi:hypothetical protein
VLDKGSYEDDRYKITRVIGFKRAWNVAKLEKLLPRGIFKNITKTEADPAKIDEYVKAGRIKLKEIEPAFEETPLKAYPKWTEKKGERGQEEADSLAAKLA